MERIVIWGTGIYGNMAYYYYREKQNILYYVDSDKNKQGKRMNGYLIYSPDRLLQEDPSVIIVVAVKNNKEIKTILNKKYGYDSFVEFYVNESYLNNCYIDFSNKCIVCFNGGLGNQMFQYAFYKAMEKCNKNLLANTYTYNRIGSLKFNLVNVFKRINVETISTSVKDIILSKDIGCYGTDYYIYNEDLVTNVQIMKPRLDLLNHRYGFFQGYFQTCKFADMVKKDLYKEYIFDITHDKGLQDLSNEIICNNYVSIHIRRGDYLTENNKKIYGGICTKKYYESAMQYMIQNVLACKFCFVSNDIDWVKKNYPASDALYINSELFECYEDWYDMYIMSICKHNIIANSTFSWWGAWLNKNPNKIVIAPKRWVNSCEYVNIYPSQWIIMGS